MTEHDAQTMQQQISVATGKDEEKDTIDTLKRRAKTYAVPITNDTSIAELKFRIEFAEKFIRKKLLSDTDELVVGGIVSNVLPMLTREEPVPEEVVPEAVIEPEVPTVAVVAPEDGPIAPAKSYKPSGMVVETTEDLDGEPIDGEDIDGVPLDDIDGVPFDDDIDGVPIDDDIDGVPLDEDIDGAPIDDDIDGAPIDDDIDGVPVEGVDGDDVDGVPIDDVAE